MEKDEVKKTGITELARARDFRRGHIRPLEVKPVSDHQLDVMSVGSPDHRTTFSPGYRHRFLAQNVDTGARRTHGVFGMEMVGQRDINRVHRPAA
jgi:hypothetical protein